MNDDWLDAMRYASRASWLIGDDLRASMAGERIFGHSSYQREWVGGGGHGATVLRDGPWRKVVTLSGAGALDGWWRESTPAERRSLRVFTIGCATHGVGARDAACGAAGAGCVQVMRRSSDWATRRYRERHV